MEQTLTAPLNNTIDFLVTIFIDSTLIFRVFLQGLGNDFGQTTVGYEQMLDEVTREGERASPFLDPWASLVVVVLGSVCERDS